MKEKITNFVKKIKINEKAINYLLILILGFLVGVAVKTEAKKRITIGYSDYLMSAMKQDFDLMKPEPKVAPQENQGQSPNNTNPEEPASSPSEENQRQ
ncbi:MAG: hypothetical protein A3J76_04285 [Candidatus Moranbacteria bacterium RBG_13_45_13]|nr:MAG: hypothetical protein A3J76_04285 [Candidatus Moranbacteria bacterium RBG_13_45_13]